MASPIAAITTTGAQALVDALVGQGVNLAFGLPGVHNLPLWQALAASSVRLVGVRHEQAAAYAADGYARASGRLGVALVTTGPGAANTLAAVGEARESGSPVLVIATDVSTRLRRDGVHRGALHETRDQAALFRPLVKASFVANASSDLRVLIERACAAARAAPAGPVYLGVPTDLLSTAADERAGTAAPPVDHGRRVAVNAGAMAHARRLVDEAERPLIWAGSGAIGAAEAVVALAERIGAPVLETFGGRGIVPPDHPSWVGLPPHVPEVGELWDRADLVIAIGSDFDGMMTQNWSMPQPPQLVAINVDPVDARKNYAADVVLQGDAAPLTAALVETAVPRERRRALVLELDHVRRTAWTTLSEESPVPSDFLADIRAALPAETIVVADMCIPGYWISGFHPFAQPRRLAYPVGWGTLGFAFPASLGSALATDAPVLCVCGDGGFLMACGELATAVQEQIPLTVLLVDDAGYGMLRYDQRGSANPSFGVDLTPPDFVAMTQAFGVAAEEVPGLGEPLRASLREHLAMPGPSLLTLRLAMEPPVTTSPRWYRGHDTSVGLEKAPRA